MLSSGSAGCLSFLLNGDNFQTVLHLLVIRWYV